MRRWLVAAGLAVVIAGAAGGAGATKPHSEDCTWGASSIAATIAHGQVTQTTLAVSGCAGREAEEEYR